MAFGIVSFGAFHSPEIKFTILDIIIAEIKFNPIFALSFFGV